MKLPVRYLLPGMVLNRPIIGKDNQIILSRGSRLTSSIISSLKKYGVIVADITITGEDLNQKDIDYTVSLNALSLIQGMVTGVGLDYRRITYAVDLIIEEILEGKSITMNLTDLCSVDMYTFAHCVDVCILSVAIGGLLNYDRKILIELGTGSLLHDIGKMKIPMTILRKPGKLSQSEYEEIKKHTCYGNEMAKGINNVSPTSREIILYHHEKYDGTGYPRGLKGSEISNLISICSIADIYNAITTDRVYRKALPPHEAYEMILASGNLLIKKEIVTAFLQLIKPYPVGSVVLLSNGLTGIVVELKEEFILRPVVKILETNEIVDLRKELSLVITGLACEDKVGNIKTI